LASKQAQQDDGLRPTEVAGAKRANAELVAIFRAIVEGRVEAAQAAVQAQTDEQHRALLYHLAHAFGVAAGTDRPPSS
jgi:hypothetical protein